MTLSDLEALKGLSIQPGSVYFMRFYPSDGVRPKNPGDKYRDKYFVILGRDDEGNLVALSLINTEINGSLFNRIGPYQHLLYSSDYSFLKGKDRYVDCYQFKDVSVLRIVQYGEYIGTLSEEDMKAVLGLVAASPTAIPARLRQFSITY